MFSFQGASEFLIPKRLNEVLSFKSASVNLFDSSLVFEVVGQNGLEPSTSRLSVVCSSQLSYWPVYRRRKLHITRFGHSGVQSSLTALRLLSKSNPSYFGFDLVPSHFLSGGD